MNSRRRGGSGEFPFPWIQNVQNVVDHAVNAAADAADHFVATLQRDGFPLRGSQEQQQQQQQQRSGTIPMVFATMDGVGVGVGAPPSNGPASAPPASTRAIRQLPTIRVAPEDLVEAVNRECCICLDENNLNDKVMRLPCAHIFHSHCIIDWLSNHHCTCPVCRYELPTDDPSYEAGRLERMKHRKPRYAMYELERMTIQQLLALNKRPAPGILEKKDLIKLLIDNERVHLIPSPEPVSYKLSTLQAMGVSQLKRAMEDAGVFFHPKDVVEKSDMLTIFQNSGRLNLIPVNGDNDDVDNANSNPNPNANANETTTTTPAPNESSNDPLVETVAEESDGETSPRQNRARVDPTISPQVMFPSATDTLITDNMDFDNTTNMNSHPNDGRSTSQTLHDDQREDTVSSTTPIHETSLTDMTNVSNPMTPDGEPSLAQDSDEMVATTSERDENVTATDNERGHCLEPDGNQQDSNLANNETNNTDEVGNEGDIDRPSTEAAETGQLPNQSTETAEDISSSSAASTEPIASATVAPLASDDCGSNSDGDAPNIDSANQPTENNLGNDNQIDTDTTRSDEVEMSFFQRSSISELQTIARQWNVDLSTCVERSEMVQRLRDAGIMGDGQQQQLSYEAFSNWSVSQLRALASEVDVDLSECSDKEAILNKILVDANQERTFLIPYLRALAPLASSSISDLRAIARSWQVNISDCLEKDEIIHRLISQQRRQQQS